MSFPLFLENSLIDELDKMKDIGTMNMFSLDFYWGYFSQYTSQSGYSTLFSWQVLHIWF